MIVTVIIVGEDILNLKIKEEIVETTRLVLA